MPVSRATLPRATAGERSRADTRSRLLASGRALFAEHGLHGVTSHDIAARAGVASGTFYLHFRDKESLFRVIAEESTALLRARLDAATGGVRGSRASVPAMTEALLSFAEENRDLVRILFSRDSEAAAVEADVLSHLAANLAEARRTRIRAGELPATLDPDVLSQAVVGLLSRVVAWWIEDPSRAPRQVVVDTLTRIQLSGTHPASRAGARLRSPAARCASRDPHGSRS